MSASWPTGIVPSQPPKPINKLEVENPSKSIRLGIDKLIGSILCNLAVVAAKPGDYEPEGRQLVTVDDGSEVLALTGTGI